MLKVMTMRLQVFDGSPGVPQEVIRREHLFGDEAAAALAALQSSLAFEKGTVVVEQSPAT